MDGHDFTLKRRKDKNKKRGRKNQYYTQIDAEDDEEAEHLEDIKKDAIPSTLDQEERDLGIIREEKNEDDKKIKSKQVKIESPKK